MNLMETIKLIQDTAMASTKVEVRPKPNDPQKSLVIGGGIVTELETPFVPGPRNHTVDSVASFAKAFARWGSDSGIESNIWIDINAGELSFFCDEPLRQSAVKLTIADSPQWTLLQSFESERRLDQKVLVRMLRHDLADCVDPSVLIAFRSIDFTKIINARAAIEHGRQSMDADVVASINGEKKPEEFLVDLPLFAGREFDARTRIKLTIDIDCDDRKFVLQAKPGHIDTAMDDARAAVLVKLEAELAAAGQKDVTILHGSPNE